MADAYNLVGFQNHLRYGEQARVLRLIPGLERAEFLQYGQIHRNTYINAPRVLAPTLQMRERPSVLFAGQISGRLTVALGRLSDRQRAVFTLRHYEEMSLEEIGQILGLDVGTVKAHMFRAVSKLRVDLRDLYEGRQHERARTFK